MKLLFDENVSPRLVDRLTSEFPGSEHVRTVGLRAAEDQQLWECAWAHAFTIVSKDTDFRERSFVHGDAAINSVRCIKYGVVYGDKRSDAGGDIMPSGREMTIGRRQFVTELALGAFVAARFPFSGEATAQIEDPPNTHNMLVVGERTVFLSHLPMFAGLDKSKTAFVSPHRYQVIVEVACTNLGEDVTALYFKDRQAHPDTRIYTLGPEPFVITRLFTPRDKPRLPAFSATVVRGHLEARESEAIPGLEKTSVQVKRVVLGRMFDPKTTKPTALEYILFGTASELYLAHAIFAAPDFDQVLAVKVTGVELTDKHLATDLHVTIPSRKNLVSERLRENERVEATLRIGPPGSATSTVRLETGIQFYFEEGELLVPPTFEPTLEEAKK